MLDILNQYYESAAKGKTVTFQLTTNHPARLVKATGSATFASGRFTTSQNESVSESGGQIPALVSLVTRWHFLYSEGGHLIDYGTRRDQLILTLYLKSVRTLFWGSLRNLNWKESIPTQTLKVVSFDGRSCLCRGLDGNQAAIALAIHDIPPK